MFDVQFAVGLHDANLKLGFVGVLSGYAAAAGPLQGPQDVPMPLKSPIQAPSPLPSALTASTARAARTLLAVCGVRQLLGRARSPREAATMK
jgi:hypothetical protein